MNCLRPFHLQLFKSPVAHPALLHARFLSVSAPTFARHSSQNKYLNINSTSCHHNGNPENNPVSAPSLGSTSSLLSAPFWSCRSTWRRAGLNTLRCLVGCSIGDFSALWMLQSYCPDLGMNTIMLASSKFAASDPIRIG